MNRSKRAPSRLNYTKCNWCGEPNLNVVYPYCRGYACTADREEAQKKLLHNKKLKKEA